MSADTIIGRSKRVEGALKRHGYQGRGIHEMLSNAGSAIPDDVKRVCRRIATQRNKSVHEEGFSMMGDRLEQFCRDADWVVERLAHLKNLSPDNREASWRSDAQTDVTPDSYPEGRSSRARKTPVAVVIFMIVLVAGCLIYLSGQGERERREADLKLGLDASHMLNVQLHRKSELIVQKLTGTVTTNTECEGRVFHPTQRTKAPVSLLYTLDLKSVGPSSYLWNAKDKRLTIKVPDVRVGEPNINAAA
jgi:hypothetical protein